MKYCIKENIRLRFIFALSPCCQRANLRLSEFKTIFKLLCSLERLSIIYCVWASWRRSGTISKCRRAKTKTWALITLFVIQCLLLESCRILLLLYNLLYVIQCLLVESFRIILFYLLWTFFRAFFPQEF